MKNLSVTRGIGRVESTKAVRNRHEVLLCVLGELDMNGNDRLSGNYFRPFGRT